MILTQVYTSYTLQSAVIIITIKIIKLLHTKCKTNTTKNQTIKLSHNLCQLMFEHVCRKNNSILSGIRYFYIIFPILYFKPIEIVTEN